MQLHGQHYTPIAWSSLVAGLAADALLHGFLTTISIVGVAVSIGCQLVQTHLAMKRDRMPPPIVRPKPHLFHVDPPETESE